MFLLDILEACERVTETAGHLDLDTLRTDWTVQAIVLWNLQVIGEAVRNIPEDIRRKSLDIEWRRIRGLRNRIAHEYFGINWEITYNIIHNHVPPLTAGIKRLLEEFNDNQSDDC